MALFNTTKILCLGALLSLSIFSHANSPHNIYMITLSIMSYTKWPNQNPSLCIMDNPTISEHFNSTVKLQKSQIIIKSIKVQELSKEDCNAVFFSNMTPDIEHKLISTTDNAPVLSFSINNQDCEIGSIFCLNSIKNGNTLFKVNLDSLARAKIHIDPRVLILAQRSE